MSISDRLDRIERDSVDASGQWNCGRSALNADNHAPPIDAALVNGEHMLAALRAVLDLHEGAPNSVSAMYPDPACNECGQTMPCPTVRAIATALGEEAGDQ